MTASSVKMAATISGSPFSQASIHCALPLSIARLASANVSGAASGPADGFLACEKTGWAAKRKMIVPRRNRFILESPFVRRTLYRRKGQLVGHRTDNMSHAASIFALRRNRREYWQKWTARYTMLLSKRRVARIYKKSDPNGIRTRVTHKPCGAHPFGYAKFFSRSTWTL